MPVKELTLSNPQFEVLESTAQRILMHCGVGSGKSHVAGLISIEYAIKFPEVRGFIGANSYSQLAKATLDRIFKVWAEMGIVEDQQFVVDKIPPSHFKIVGTKLKSYENTISFDNGALIFVASLDNYKMIDGTEFGWAILDETKDTREEAVKEVIVARLRQKGMYVDKKGVLYHSMKEGRTGFNPLYILTSPAKTKWIQKWFALDKNAEEIEATIYQNGKYYRKKTGDQLVVIASTYHNPHNSHGYIDRLKEDLGGNDQLIKMLVYGSPFAKDGGEFYSAFSRMKHVKKFDPWPNEPVHLSFDFNLVPYISCTCWQMKTYYCEERKQTRMLVRCFREYCLPNPKNNAESLSKEIKNTIHNLLKNGVFIYGDYSGKTDNTVSEDIRNQFDMIELVLRQYVSNSSFRVTTNKLHVRRRDFMNKLLSSGYAIDIEIDESCVETIADFEFVKESAKGGKLKTKVTNGKQSYEEHGHTSDTVDYLFCSAFENLFIDLFKK